MALRVVLASPKGVSPAPEFPDSADAAIVFSVVLADEASCAAGVLVGAAEHAVRARTQAAPRAHASAADGVA